MVAPDLALCVRQPWIELIARKLKKEEIRSWPPPRLLKGNRILLVSSLSWSPGAREIMARYNLTEADCPRGVSVCTVKVLGARETDHGWCEAALCDVDDFSLAWGLRGAQRVPNVPIRGRLGIFTPTERELQPLREALCRR